MVPTKLTAFSGVTVMDCTAAVVSRAEPETVPVVAEIIALPMLTAVASPSDPAALLTVATPVSEELQVTEAVRSTRPPCELRPVAVKREVVPGAMVADEGATVMAVRETGCGFELEPEQPQRSEVSISATSKLLHIGILL